jgi:hypothetical protein
MKMGANDASGQGLQSAVKTSIKIVFEEITGIRSQVPAIFTENSEVSDSFGSFQIIYFF